MIPATRQFTAGPYHHDRDFDGVKPRILAPVNWSGDPEAREVVCVATVNTGLPEWEANAQLIASAPDLYAALQMFEQGPPDGDNTDGWFAQYALNLRFARAALARAEGRQV